MSKTKISKQATRQALLKQYGLEDIPTVSQLRQTGSKVEVEHFRRVSGFTRKDNGGQLPVFPHYTIAPEDLDPKGGATQVKITLPSGNVIQGRQNCQNEDPYCRSVGVAFAIRNALKSVQA